MRTLGLLGILAVSLVASDRTRTRNLCAGFLPENNMRIAVGDVNALGIDEPAFNAVLDKAAAFYTPVVAAKGGKLVVVRKWTDPTVNAYAQQSGKTWTITMFGGLARHKAVTADGFALVACHEIGHHIGGFPKIAGNVWATNEGGSDYFSTLKCLRNILGKTAPATVDPLAKAGCAKAFPDAASRALCENGTMAGVSVSSLLAELGGEKQPTLATPDTSVVGETDDTHPAAQCRLDTYYQAAVCVKPVAEELSNVEPAAGACTTASGFQEGVRPLCWFKPPVRVDEKLVNSRLEALTSAMAGRGI